MSKNGSHAVVILKGVWISGKWHVGCGDIDFMLLRASADRALQVYEDKPSVAIHAELFPFVKLTTDFDVSISE